MIFDFSKELEELKGKEGVDAAFVLAKVYAQGIADERERIIRIIQRNAVNPMSVVNQIRRPVR